MTRTVRIKIAVGVSPKGQYNATGCTGMDEKDSLGMASEVWDKEADDFASHVRTFWVYADLPIPETPEIEASGIEEPELREYG